MINNPMLKNKSNELYRAIMGLEEWVLSIMEKLGYLGIAFFSITFSPIPSEIIMPSAGYTASKGIWLNGRYHCCMEASGSLILPR